MSTENIERLHMDLSDFAGRTQPQAVGDFLRSVASKESQPHNFAVRSFGASGEKMSCAMSSASLRFPSSSDDANRAALAESRQQVNLDMVCLLASLAMLLAHPPTSLAGGSGHSGAVILATSSRILG